MEILNIAFLKALGITLFHSIWQATLIALLMTLILGIMKRDNAKHRYMVAISSLIILFFTSIATFFIVYQPSMGEAIPLKLSQMTTFYGQITLLSSEQGLIQGIKAIIVENTPWIALIWALGMLFFAGKIVLGLNFLRGLKSKSRIIDHEGVWKLLKRLKAKAHYNKYIGLRESLKVKTPSVVGFLKPCIYLPVGLINNLSPSEAEAIIAHELAHIIRNDFAINILQSFMETLYYFHPAVWWISANIRTERENACDDLAVAIIGDRVSYAKSLLSLQVWESKKSNRMAMNFSSKKSPLFNRMKRILNQPQNKYGMKQKVIASLILMSSIIWISATEIHHSDFEESNAYSSELESAEVPKEEGFDLNKVFTDTIPKRVKESKSTIIELKDGKIKRLEIDGQEIPEEDFEEHSALLGQMRSPNHTFSDSILFGGKNSFRYFMGDEDNIEDILSQMKINQDSMWANLDGNFQKLENLKKFDHEWRFDFDESRMDMDSMLQNFSGQNFFFHHDDLDSLRFDLDNMNSKMGTFQFNFEDMGDRFRMLDDSLTYFDQDNFRFFDSLDFREFEEIHNFHGNSFDFSDGDQIHYFGNNLENAFLKELEKDGFYKKDENQLILGFDKLEINGEEQPSEVHMKYKDIYESRTGIELQEGSILNINIVQDDKKKGLRKL